MNDTRVWMYRDGEARCFADRNAVPPDEGWTDSPVRDGGPSATDALGGRISGAARSRTASQGNSGPTLDALRARAAALGIAHHPNAGLRKLTRLIKEAEDHGA